MPGDSLGRDEVPVHLTPQWFLGADTGCDLTVESERFSKAFVGICFMNGSSEQESWFPEAVSEEVFTFRGERKAETRHKAGNCPARTQGCSLSLASQWATLNRWVHSALRASQTRLQTGVVRGQSALLRKPAGTVSSKATCYRLGDLSAVKWGSDSSCLQRCSEGRRSRCWERLSPGAGPE